jgi:gamma-glutamylcyclotransferase (GGCT)/AIG2-like uncharacterized protein YtfP
MNQYLFVYGTLLSGYDDKASHNYLNRFGELVGKATMKGKMFMVDYYPGVVLTNENSIVRGELYQIIDAESLFDFLDKYEECVITDILHSEYKREMVDVTLKSTGQIYQAWVYLYNQPTDELELLPKGDFLNEYHK